MIRLLVVDDSPLMRRLMGVVFEAAGDFEVEFARDGQEALERLNTFAPHVVTLDVEMPRMNGLDCLDQIMLKRPTPVVMVSALTTHGAETTLDALDLGAVAFVPKPARANSLAVEAIAAELVETVRAAAGAKLRSTHRLKERVRARAGLAPHPVKRRATRTEPPPAPVKAPKPAAPVFGDVAGLVLVGASTGGPPALDALLGALPADFPWPVLVAQHMPSSFTGPLARRLDGLCALNVREVKGPIPLAAGQIYIAAGDADMVVAKRPAGLVAQPVPSHAEHRWHPSVNRLVESALEHFPAERLAAVLMTGMGDDGAREMTRLRERGGRTIAEAMETAVVWGMPGALVDLGGAEFTTPLPQIGKRLISLVAAS